MRGGPEAASEDMIPQEKVDSGAVWVGVAVGWPRFFFFPNLAARGRVTSHGAVAGHILLRRRTLRRRRRAGEVQRPSISKNTEDLVPPAI